MLSTLNYELSPTLSDSDSRPSKRSRAADSVADSLASLMASSFRDGDAEELLSSAAFAMHGGGTEGLAEAKEYLRKVGEAVEAAWKQIVL